MSGRWGEATDEPSPYGVPPPARDLSELLCELLRGRHSTHALDLAGELLIRGVNKAATTIYFIIHFAKPASNLSLASFNNQHCERLLSMALDPDEGSWALKALQAIC